MIPRFPCRACHGSWLFALEDPDTFRHAWLVVAAVQAGRHWHWCE